MQEPTPVVTAIQDPRTSASCDGPAAFTAVLPSVRIRATFGPNPVYSPVKSAYKVSWPIP